VKAADGVTPAVRHDSNVSAKLPLRTTGWPGPRERGAAAQQRVRQGDAQAQLQGVGVLRE